MALPIICHVITLIKSMIMKLKNIQSKTTLQGNVQDYLSLQESILEKRNVRESRLQKRWLSLPYRLRLWIEHKVYVSSVIVKNESKITPSVSKMLLLPVARKLSRFVPVLKKLNNPYKPFTNAPISDPRAAERVEDFLKRCPNHLSNSISK